jgi:bla regulator protein blaR1
MGFGRGFINGRSANMGLLCRVLETFLERPIVNQTGNSGEYEIYLEWTPEPGEAASVLGAAADLADPKLGSIFTELQEKLGLRLDSKRAPTGYVRGDGAEDSAIR